MTAHVNYIMSLGIFFSCIGRIMIFKGNILKGRIYFFKLNHKIEHTATFLKAVYNFILKASMFSYEEDQNINL